MSWVRIDDGFTANAKIIQLTDREFRVWMRLLCHCSRTKDPSVDRIALNEVAGLTKPLMGRFASLELLDPVGGAFEVHDWPQYQPKDATSAERQAKWRARKAVTETVTPAVTETVTSLARAREPVPVPVPEDVDVSALPLLGGLEEKLWRRLVVAAGAKSSESVAKLVRTIKANRCSERDVVCAIEAATGPGVRDPLAVALSELKRRAGERIAV